MNPAGILKSTAGRARAVLVVATLLALFFATKDSLHQLALGYKIAWVKNLWWKSMEWYAWAAFSPFIFRACRRFDFSTSRWRTATAQLILAAIFSLLHCCILATGARIEAQVLQTGFSWMELFGFVVPNHFHENVLTYAAIVSVWYALDYYSRYREREQRAAELEAHLATARLQTLKMQLHPHFLFNTLNGIAALNYEDPKGANRMLARLSELLRMSLDDSGAQEVPLQQELNFNRCYLDLEKIRLGDRLTVHWEIGPETLEASVPNLLLQPLLENAIRHGIAPVSVGGEIWVHAHRDNGNLHLRVTDNGPGLAASHGGSPISGVGLNNTRARLRQLYGSSQWLELKKGENGGLTIEITIPFRTIVFEGGQIGNKYEDSHTHRG